jgi:GAF domain-containing protein
MKNYSARERVLFEITDKIRRTTDMQTILTTTVSELTRAVGANRTYMKVGIASSNDEKTGAL